MLASAWLLVSQSEPVSVISSVSRLVRSSRPEWTLGLALLLE
jgi:hypothetical protein